jgi:hypothetical protein
MGPCSLPPIITNSVHIYHQQNMHCSCQHTSKDIQACQLQYTMSFTWIEKHFKSTRYRSVEWHNLNTYFHWFYKHTWPLYAIISCYETNLQITLCVKTIQTLNQKLNNEIIVFTVYKSLSVFVQCLFSKCQLTYPVRANSAIKFETISWTFWSLWSVSDKPLNEVLPSKGSGSKMNGRSSPWPTPGNRYI